MNLKTTLISLVSVLVVGLTAILLYCFWPAIKGTVDESKYYTQEELQESYDKGYNDGCKSETELTGQVKYYKGLVDEYYIQVNTLNDEITMLTNTKKTYETQIANLESQKTTLNTEINNLKENKTQNEQTITNLNKEITSLNSQIDSLNSTIKTNEQTISDLNYQITSLNTQKDNLNNTISKLQNSISYYETYIASLESSEQVVATFEFDGSVYNIQIVSKGAKLSVTTPTSTDYKVFNGWKVNNEFIDLSTYTISTNTKIVADITYKYDVIFKVDNVVKNTQIVANGQTPTLPNNPTKTGYEFDGWSIDGTNIVNVSTNAITNTTTYNAVFTKLHTVTFVYEDTTKSTQTIRNGNYATAVTVDNTTYKVFNGWKVNGAIVDIATYKITADTQFVADITYKYDVKFIDGDTTYNTQIVTLGQAPTLPTAPTKDGYEFNGWSINNDIVDISSYKITENTTFYAVWDSTTCTVKFYSTNTNLVQESTIQKNSIIETLPTVDFVVDKYCFYGWGLKDDSSTIYTVDELQELEITENTEFFAYYRCYEGEFSSKNGSITVIDNTMQGLFDNDIQLSYDSHSLDLDGSYFTSLSLGAHYKNGSSFWELYYSLEGDFWCYTVGTLYQDRHMQECEAICYSRTSSPPCVILD